MNDEQAASILAELAKRFVGRVSHEELGAWLPSVGKLREEDALVAIDRLGMTTTTPTLRGFLEVAHAAARDRQANWRAAERRQEAEHERRSGTERESIARANLRRMARLLAAEPGSETHDAILAELEDESFDARLSPHGAPLSPDEAARMRYPFGLGESRDRKLTRNLEPVRSAS